MKPNIYSRQYDEMTAEEKAEIKKIGDEIAANDKAKADDKIAKENLKTSAKQKLMNGEALTEDEANVMVGL